MSETMCYADNFSQSFGEQQECLEFLREREENASWRSIPTREVRFEAIDESSTSGKVLCNWYRLMGKEGILQDTMANTQLLLRAEDALYPVRSCALATILSRARISGHALSKVSKPVLAQILNHCVSVASGKALLRLSDEKVSAMHGGDESEYAVLEIPELFQAVTDQLETDFGSCRFISGHYEHAMMTAIWSFPNNQELMEACEETARKHGIHAGQFVPALRFSTSDVGISGANLYPMLMEEKSGRSITLGSALCLEHSNLDFCAFACLFGNSEGDFLMREIGRDLEEEEMTILELTHFWQDFVAANVEPPYTESGDLVLESIRRYQGKADPSLPKITLASSEVQRLEQFLKLREEKDGLEYGDDFLFLSAGQADEAAQLVLNTYQEAISRQNLLDVQILAPFRSRGECSVKRLNEEIQKLINPPDPHKKEIKYGAQVFRELDKVIQTKNREAVSNGDVGLIVSITQDEEEGNILRVLFSDERAVDYTVEELSQLELAYATTIHKSQGSEYHTVIIPILKNQYIMLRRNLIYTAVSRAKRQVVLVGQKQALYIAIDKNDIDQRNTLLADRIVSYYQQMNAGKRKNSA